MEDKMKLVHDRIKDIIEDFFEDDLRVKWFVNEIEYTLEIVNDIFGKMNGKKAVEKFQVYIVLDNLQKSLSCVKAWDEVKDISDLSFLLKERAKEYLQIALDNCKF